MSGITANVAPQKTCSAPGCSEKHRRPGLYCIQHREMEGKPAAAGGAAAGGTGESFIEGLTPEGLAYFNSVSSSPFSVQAVAFLNAYWNEVGSQAEFIYSCAWEQVKACDMHAKGLSLVHLYEEGNDLDFNIGLYFYEKLCKQVLDDPDNTWRNPAYSMSQPEMLTAIVRKKELREKVDVNFDGRIGFIEYLLYQYRAFANPADFITRSMHTESEHPEITAAKRALEAVNAAIKAFEAEKYRLEEAGKGTGVAAMKAKHSLAILFAGPLAEELNKSLIVAEAAVRRAIRLYGDKQVAVTDAIRARGGEGAPRSASLSGRPNQGSLWWMGKDLEVKKARYGKVGNKK